MARIICFLDGHYFEFSSIADGPVTGLMAEEEFVEYSTRLYGELYRDDEGVDGLRARMERARTNGHSRMLPDDYKTLEEFITANMREFSTYNEATDDFDLDKWPGIGAFKRDYLGGEPGDDEVVQLDDMDRTQE